MTHIAISSLGLGFLFLLSATAKWADFNWFREAVEAYKIVPRRMTALTALGLLLAESLTGTMMSFRLEPRLGSYASVALLSLFSIAITINLLRGRTAISCGCALSNREDTISWSLVTRNLSLILVGIVTTGFFASEWALSRFLSVIGVVGAVLSMWRHGAGTNTSKISRHRQRAVA